MASIGPTLPPGCEDSDDENVESKNSAIGPALPPGFKRPHTDDDNEDVEKKKSKTDAIGPALPPGFPQPEVHDSGDSSLSSSSESEAEGDVIGPELPSSGNNEEGGHSAADALERRARKMRQKLLHGDDDEEAPKGRETWMTELPKGHELSRGVVMPKAKTRLGDGRAEIDHSWTLAPGQKPAQNTSKPKNEDHQLSERDKEMAAAVAEYDKSRRAASLVDMHQDKLNKKKKKKEKKEKKEKKKKKKKEKEKEKKKKDKKEKTERRPFDRDMDLKANVFDDAKKKALIKKSAILNTRFGHGSTQFL